MWDERYAPDRYVYGKEPNDFLASVARRIPRGPALCLGDGEGRNGTYLATLGHAVTSVDSSFCHLPSELRGRVHAAAVAGLRPGECFILEAYTPDQVQYGTGGPKDPDLLVTIEELERELHGLELDIAREVVRPIREGDGHRGDGAVVQVLGVKPD